ncbi:hypothetical protein [Arthrobacter sp. BF1]|uniref:hypothetical protein n=1 Tax=Arthrobacter sp. BF1 TaxID=2821145 RepID=UPI001C4FFAE0|nr:hypothetical protein [Arthrobacter sp. BF1]
MSTQRDPLWEARRQLAFQKKMLEKAELRHVAKMADIEAKIEQHQIEVDQLEQEEGLK